MKTKDSSVKALDKMLKVSSVLIFVILTATLFYSLLKFYFINKGNKSTDTALENSTIENATWVIYKNEEFGYQMEYPLYLYPNEIKNTERYKSFVTFEETNFSELKGMAVGITDKSLIDEVSFIKDSFNDIEGTKLAETREGDNEGKKFVLLRYEVTDKENYEDKSFFIVNDGRYTMSLSTTSDQMPHVISTLKFF
jgi:hypothetical protein